MVAMVLPAEAVLPGSWLEEAAGFQKLLAFFYLIM